MTKTNNIYRNTNFELDNEILGIMKYSLPKVYSHIIVMMTLDTTNSKLNSNINIQSNQQNQPKQIPSL